MGSGQVSMYFYFLSVDFLRNCLISSRGGQGTSLQIMRLATIDPSFEISPSLVLIDPILSETNSFKNIKSIYKEMYCHPDAASG